jgi:hypothetical protein
MEDGEGLDAGRDDIDDELKTYIILLVSKFELTIIKILNINYKIIYDITCYNFYNFFE